MDIRVVLLREDLGRSHDRRLFAAGDRDQARVQSDDGLAAADVALEQARHRPAALQVGDDLAHDLLL